MADLPQILRQTITLSVGQATSRPEIGRTVGQIAVAFHEGLIRSGAASPTFQTFVDHVKDASYETMGLPGDITYIHSRISNAAQFALEKAVALSPIGRGTRHPGAAAYKESWFFLVNGQPYVGAIAQIPPGSIVTLTNRADYHRKIDVGGQQTPVGFKIVERVRKAVQDRFKGLDVIRELVTIPGGYVLKGRAFRSGLTYNKKAKKFDRLHARQATDRADSRRGEVMTYPAVTISEIL